jgi:predicted secreted protein
MLRYVLALCAVSPLACNGCNDGNTPPANAIARVSDAPATRETVVRADDDGKSFDVARAATLTFKLESNAGTGYVWVPTQVDTNVLAQQGDRTSEVSSDTPGAPKMDVYRFVAQNAGSTTVEVSLKRPFGSGPPARVIRVAVNVR